MDRLGQLIHEIHRRSLWQVLAIYAVASWAVISGVGTLGDALGLPDWFPRLALGLLVVGLPVVLATAFVQEGGPRRDTTREVEAAETAAPTSRLFAWRNAFGGGVLAFALWGVVAAGWILFGGGAQVASEEAANASVEQSVAVLPFVNMSGDPDNEYFSDGITEEILNALAQVPGLTVTSRTTSFTFKDSTLSASEIAQRIGVANVLEGSVQREGDRVRITAQLIAAGTDRHLWSERYDRDLKDVFAVEDEISGVIAGQLRVRLVDGAGSSATRGGTEDPNAHELYLLGLHELNQRGAEGLRSAADYFQRAIAEDSTYARAYAGLAQAYSLFNTYRAGTLEEYGARGEVAARQALARDSALAEAHDALGYVYRESYRWSDAERETRLAVALNPNDGILHAHLAQVLLVVGQSDEALRETNQAASLDPLGIATNIANAVVFYCTGRYDGAERAARSVLQVDSTQAVAVQLLWSTSLAQHRDADAAMELRRWAELTRQFSPDEADALSQAVADPPGATAAARRALARFDSIVPMYAADIHVRIGDRDGALNALERAVREHASTAMFIGLSPLLDPLRSDPRFQALFDQMGLTSHTG